MAKFKVGDKVVITDEGTEVPVGAKATVVVLEEVFLGLDIVGFKNGHNLNGSLRGEVQWLLASI